MRVRIGLGWGALLALALSAAAPLPARAMAVASGSYTGNGSDDRSITGLGFRPHAVLIKANGTADGVLRFSTMSGDESASLSTEKYAKNQIQALETDGFQVGTAAEVNASGTTYYWFAWQHASGTASALRYTGDSADNRSVTGAGFAPDFVFVKGDVKENAQVRSSSMSGDNTMVLLASPGASNRIQALESDGFQIGTHDAVNQRNKTYDAAVLKNETNSFAVGTYTGDGTDNRAITTVGFQPSVVLVKGDASAAAVFRSTAHSGDAASTLAGSVSANALQQMLTTGFEVGTDSTVNQNGTTYYWMAWKHVPDTTSPNPPTANPAGGTYGSNQSVTLSAEAGATIRYTADGSTPTANSPIYSSALTISATTTLKAIAIDAAGNISTVMTEIYTLSGAGSGFSASSEGPSSEEAATEESKKEKKKGASSRQPKEKKKDTTLVTVTEPPTISETRPPPPTPSVPPSAPLEPPQPPPEIPPAPQPPVSLGRIAAAFTKNLIRVAPVKETAPPPVRTISRTLRSLDTALITANAADVGLLTILVTALFRLSGARIALGPVSLLASIRFLPDYGAHFARVAPRDSQSGTFAIPFSLWKRFHRLKDLCLLVLLLLVGGKVLLAGVSTFLLLDWLPL
ncbi:MAG: FG-GAP repeat domain-containing protein [Parcubacteria group bacterium Gr01-1014_38]|nr:MAG: FG-GAP repeat domain-containing protein [Parcubacteria group bacterium Gr01-1014_38]